MTQDGCPSANVTSTDIGVPPILLVIFIEPHSCATLGLLGVKLSVSRSMKSLLVGTLGLAATGAFPSSISLDL